MDVKKNDPHVLSYIATEVLTTTEGYHTTTIETETGTK